MIPPAGPSAAEAIAEHDPAPVTRRRNRAIPLVASALAAALVALLTYGLVAQSPDTTIDDGLAQGRPVRPPSFELEAFARGRPGPRLALTWSRAAADGRVGLEELRGTPLAVNFWASWCDPCRSEAPRLQRAWRRYRGSGVLFVGLDEQDNAPDVRRFLSHFAIDYPTLKEAGDDTFRAWGLTGYPETFFIDRRGRVVSHVIGVISQAELANGVRAALSGRPAGSRRGGALGGRR